MEQLIWEDGLGWRRKIGSPSISEVHQICDSVTRDGLSHHGAGPLLHCKPAEEGNPLHPVSVRCLLYTFCLLLSFGV